MVEPEMIFICRKWLGNHVSAATNINKDYFPLQRIAANESLPGSKSLNKAIPATTQQNRETVIHGDFYPGRVAVIKELIRVSRSSTDQ
jgi:hypothetical protein